MESKYRLKPSQIFKPALQVPQTIRNKVYDRSLSVLDYFKYDLIDKVPFNYIDSKERYWINNFKPEQLVNMDINMFERYHNIVINGLYSDIAKQMIQDGAALNDIMYQIIADKIGSPYYKEIKMTDELSDSFKSSHPELFLDASVDQELRAKYIEGRLTLQEIFENYNIFKGKILSHNNFSKENSYIHNFIEKYYPLYQIIGEQYFDGIDQFFRYNDTYSIIAGIQYNTINLEQFQLINNLYPDLLNLDLIFGNNAAFVNSIGLDNIFKLGIKVNQIDASFISFVERFGIDNIIRFNQENNHFFTNKDGIIQNIWHDYLMYANANAISHPEKNLLFTETFTYEQFNEAIKRMIMYGPSNLQPKGVNFNNISGSFRNQNENLFLPENAPEDLKIVFSEKNITAAYLQAHPQYIMLVQDKLSLCTKEYLLKSLNSILPANDFTEIIKLAGTEITSFNYLNLDHILEKIIIKFPEIINIFANNKAIFDSLSFNKKANILKNTTFSDVQTSPEVTQAFLSILPILELNPPVYKEWLRLIIKSKLGQEQQLPLNILRAVYTANDYGPFEMEQMITNYIQTTIANQPQMILEQLEAAITTNDIHQVVIITKSLFQAKYQGEALQQGLTFIQNYLKTLSISPEIATKFYNQIIYGGINIISLDYIKNDKTALYAIFYGNIYNQNMADFVQHQLNIESIAFSNPKQINHLVQLLTTKEIPIGEATILAHRIYQSIGYNGSYGKNESGQNITGRGLHLLTDEYGVLTAEQIRHLFGDIDLNNVLFTTDEPRTPILNDHFIRLLFGESYKVNDTLIKKMIERHLDPESKKFIDRIGRVFNEFDIIDEEFLKADHISKLELKKNIKTINRILDVTTSQELLNQLEPRDQPLLDARVFEYVGVDNKYVNNPSSVYQRTIALSRMQDDATSKKFPNTTATNGDLTARVIHPQDREILCMGHKTNCCFRPNGNADSNGNGNSLLTYCISNEYGGGLVIKDNNDQVIMFSPILRNGNILIMHSLESHNLDQNTLYQSQALIKQWAEQVMQESVALEGKDAIKAVVATDLHGNLDKTLVTGNLPFKPLYYDPNNDFNGIYHNLGNATFILAMEPGTTVDQLKTDVPVEHSYDYQVHSDYQVIVVSDEEQIAMEELDNIQDMITVASNQRQESIQKGLEQEAIESLRQIQEYKKAFLIHYKELLENTGDKGRNPFIEYQRAKLAVEAINQELGIPNDFSTINQIKYGMGWYIIVNDDYSVTAHATPRGESQLNIVLEQTYKTLPTKELEGGLER